MTSGRQSTISSVSTIAVATGRIIVRDAKTSLVEIPQGFEFLDTSLLVGPGLV